MIRARRGNRSFASCVSTVGPDETRVRQSIRKPNQRGRCQGELNCEWHQWPRRGLPQGYAPNRSYLTETAPQPLDREKREAENAG